MAELKIRHLADIDPSFIQPIEHRSKAKVVESDEIPVIDLSKNREEVVSEIGKACEEWGFFQVINHGVPIELCKKAANEAKKFFEMSLEEKKKVQRDEGNTTGYHDADHTKEVRDWKEVFFHFVEDTVQLPPSYGSHDLEDDLTTLTNRWPQNPPNFRETSKEYAREVEKLAFKLLELISLSLSLAGDKFHDCFKDPLSYVVFNYYPSCPFPDLILGISPHTDAGAITLLAQDDVGGLRVKRESDGAWIPIKPIPNAFIINLGEVFQIWSNNKYKSVEHKVVMNTERGRFSNALLFNPNHSVMVKPAEELINGKNPAIYSELNFGKFFSTRTRSDFKKQGVENLQFHHFRVRD